MKPMPYWSISSIILTEEARNLWLEVEVISKEKNLFYISGNNKKILFKSTDFWWNSALSMKISDDKELTYKILEYYNLPIAKTWYIQKSEIDELHNLPITFPVIIKPINEAHGNWVKMNITSKKELVKKLEESFNTYDSMILQRQISWNEYRLLVVKWEVILWIQRIPAYVIWDGKNTIEKLIEIENSQNPLRWEWYNNPLAYIKVEQELLDFIWKKGFELSSIPKKWENIQLRWNSNLGTWGIPIDITKSLHGDIKKEVTKAIEILWMEIAGIDIITSDIWKSLKETGGIILEVNNTPWIWWHKELTKVNSWKIILKKVFNI